MPKCYVCGRTVEQLKGKELGRGCSCHRECFKLAWKLLKETNDKSVFFDNLIIETPNGEKTHIHPVNAYAPNYQEWGVLAERKRDEQWYGQFVDISAELKVRGLFIEAEFKASAFLKLLKDKGYKVYFV